MLLGFNFIVFSVRDEDCETLLPELMKLGFTCCNVHQNKRVSFWYQNKILIQVQSGPTTEFKGFGLILQDDSIIKRLDLPFDSLTGWYKATDPNGIEFYLLDGAEVERTLLKLYVPFNAIPEDLMDLTVPAGMVLNYPVTDEVKAFYKDLGFKATKDGNLTRFTPPDKRFTLSIGEKGIDSKHVLYMDCNDVFSSIAKLMVNEFQQVPTHQPPGKSKIGIERSRLTAAYEATGFGSETNYSIEKIIKRPLSNIDMDMIIRERNQVRQISEKNVDFLYALNG